jgi:hypothetical protein
VGYRRIGIRQVERAIDAIGEPLHRCVRQFILLEQRLLDCHVERAHVLELHGVAGKDRPLAPRQ